MPLLRVPKITWYTAYANTLDIAWPLERARAFSKPAPGYSVADAPSGARDTWSTGMQQFLSGIVRWIPYTNVSTPYVATGWDGASGWRAFLEWCWAGGQPRWFPDKTSGTFQLCDLLEPLDLEGQLDLSDADGSRQFPILLRTADASIFTEY